MRQLQSDMLIFLLGTNVTDTVTDELPDVSVVVPVADAGMDPLVSLIRANEVSCWNHTTQ